MTDDLTDDIIDQPPDEAVEEEARSIAHIPAEVDPTAAHLPDDVYTDEIVDTRTPEDI